MSNGIYDAVDRGVDKVHTRSLDLSFNELLDMYESGELVIRPDFQRLFRWSFEKRSRFIESLILEMPIPPIFVIEIDEGRYELIDGLQRISTYLHFRGSHPDYTEDTEEEKYLTLTGCDIVPDLNGLRFEELPTTLEIRLKRSFIRVQVIREESDEKLRYYMFKRLNEGGENLKPQEVRNSSIRLLPEGEKLTDFVQELSGFEPFRETISGVSSNKMEQQYDDELVVRFLAHKNYREEFEKVLKDYLTNFMEIIAGGQDEIDSVDDLEFDYDDQEHDFKKTFILLAKALGTRAFSGMNDQGTLVEGFRTLHFDAISQGLQYHLDEYNANDAEDIERLEEKLTDLKSDSEFQEMTTGGGNNYSSALEDRIEYVADFLEDSQ